MSVRRASHAGSWYTADGRQLRAELDDWLRKADQDPESGPVPPGGARAIIGPHAGYRYCGANAAYAYRQIDPSRVRRVFVLGPSHHYSLGGCAVSSCAQYETPLYNLPIDPAINEELLATGEFEMMNVEQDEDEHSIEMHLSYIARIMEPRKGQFTVVPVLVGSLSHEKQIKYGRIFARYLADPSNVFVISSDFCHWGQRFRYQHYDDKCGDIWQSIKALDYAGMNIIETLDHDAFTAYLKKYGNTICGRNPIGVLLGTIAAMRSGSNGVRMGLRFLNYDQSSKCKSMRDSSVSYAAAAFTIGSS